MGRSRIEISNEEIYNLREQGLSYNAISKHFEGKGIIVSLNVIRLRCKEIYKEKGQEEKKAIMPNQILEIIDEELFSLREQGLSYAAIAKYYQQKGVKVCAQTIKVKCIKIYKNKGKEEPKLKKGIKKKSEVSDEEIYNLREKGLSYNAIAKLFEDRNIKISSTRIRLRCKEIYKEKQKEEPKTKTKLERSDVSDEEIYALREQGLGYLAIAKNFERRGINVATMTIARRCKKIYKEKKQEEPKLKHGKMSGIRRIKLSKDYIYSLREYGLSYYSMEKYYKSKGINVNKSTIRLRCKEVYKEKQEKEPMASGNRGKQEEILASLEERLQEALLKKGKSLYLLEQYEELEAKENGNGHTTKQGEER